MPLVPPVTRARLPANSAESNENRVAPVVIRSSLTTFYSKSRYQIINQGGMLYQFLGDGVIAFFGVPDRSERYAEAALDCARDLVGIGNSVSNKWRREIDRVQASRGVHILADQAAFSELPPVEAQHVDRVRAGDHHVYHPVDCDPFHAALRRTPPLRLRHSGAPGA